MCVLPCFACLAVCDGCQAQNWLESLAKVSTLSVLEDVAWIPSSLRVFQWFLFFLLVLPPEDWILPILMTVPTQVEWVLHIPIQIFLKSPFHRPKRNNSKPYPREDIALPHLHFPKASSHMDKAYDIWQLFVVASVHSWHEANYGYFEILLSLLSFKMGVGGIRWLGGFRERYALHFFLFPALVPVQFKAAMNRNSYWLGVFPLKKECDDLWVAKKDFQDILGNCPALFWHLLLQRMLGRVGRCPEILRSGWD